MKLIKKVLQKIGFIKITHTHNWVQHGELIVNGRYYFTEFRCSKCDERWQQTNIG